MSGTYLPALVAALTPTRLTGYRLTPGDPALTVLSRYVWDMELRASLYPSMDLLEIGLRNRLDAVIGARDGPTWYDDPLVLINPDAQVAVADAKARLQKQGKVVSPPGVVSTLDFGFWTSLFDRGYEQGGAGPVGWKPLWPSLLPSVARGRSRQHLAGRLNTMRKLRNRMSHHEPIWRGMGSQTLDQLHSDLIEAIRWIDESLAKTAVLFDDFPRLNAAGPEWYANRLVLLDV